MHERRQCESCNGRSGKWPVWAVPVQAGKVCNHRASPNRHLSSIPRNGYGPANMQCAGRATAHREPLVDGKIGGPVNVGFREAAARHAMAGQSPERAVLSAVRVLAIDFANVTICALLPFKRSTGGRRLGARR